MFLATVLDTIFWIFFIASVGPAIALMVVIYNQDKVEHEPFPLLMKLVGGGCLAAIPAMILESIGEPLLTKFIDPGSPLRGGRRILTIVLTASSTPFLSRWGLRRWRTSNM